MLDSRRQRGKQLLRSKASDVTKTGLLLSPFLLKRTAMMVHLLITLAPSTGEPRSPVHSIDPGVQTFVASFNEHH
jgi:hypothetical protein